MSKAAVHLAQKRKPSKLDVELAWLLEAREALVSTIREADDEYSDAVNRAEKAWAEAVGKAPKELEAVDMQLASFLERNHHNLSRRHTKTIKRDAGEVKFVLRAPELELPEGHAPIIDFFLSRVGGKRYLIRTWKLNKMAIRHAPDSTFGLLKPFGAWRGRHRQILVKSPSEEKSVTISNKRHNER